MNLLYTSESIIGRLFRYFSAYFVSATRPTRLMLTWLAISTIAMESFPSVRHLHRSFLSRVSAKSINSYYYACAKAKMNDDDFAANTVKLALSIVPDALRNEPVFLSTDDTIVVKFGKCFERVSILHDHSMRTGKQFVNGHCFVSLTLCVPVIRHHHEKPFIAYVAVPLGYRMWGKENSKLDMAASMVSDAMASMADRQVILSFDSWYAKRNFIEPLQSFDNLCMVCSARHDTAIYDLPPAKTGKRGRPAKRGAKLSLADFDLKYKYGRLVAGHRRVLTNIFGDAPVHAYVTQSASGSKRLFFCTADPASIHMSCAWQEKASLRHVGPEDMECLPLRLYEMRWSIETNYYEQKMFWDLGKYMLRSNTGIERVVNLINVAHVAVKILPYKDNRLREYQGKSPQETRFALSEQIREQVFLADLGAKAQTSENYNALMILLGQMTSGFRHVA